MKKTLVFITPHLSTGGLPQYLFKAIEAIHTDMNVYCIEWENITGGVFVVQRNRIQQILGKNLITLPTDKHELFNILHTINPDIIHLQEIPELFMPNDIADRLYASDRKYVLIETSHDSSYNVKYKQYLPDKFLMVSDYQSKDYATLGMPCDIVEYPIENKLRTKTREQALQRLGLDPNLKHVINVGLFTPRKNQLEIIQYAKELKYYPIQFHFIGNQADNFKSYWEPLMRDFPSNCKWWGERDDVDAFYEAADLFLFTSRGHDTDKETMPLVIREALSWKVPSLIYNLPVYMGYFDKYDTIEYLTEDIQKNTYRIAEKLLRDTPVDVTLQTSCVVISAYPTTKSSTNITKECIDSVKRLGLPVILTSHCTIPEELKAVADYYVEDDNNILTYNSYYQFYWYESYNPPFKVQVNITKEKNNIYHGPAVYTNYYNGIQLANSLGFENVHCMNYDMILSNNTPITVSEAGLLTHSAVFGIMRMEEGTALRTYWFSSKVKFFLEKFRKIVNEMEYDAWWKQVDSPSNSLETIFYHTLAEDLHATKMLPNDQFISMFNESKIDICSLVEYSTILPIENNPNEAIIWYTSSNIQDNRTLKIWLNDSLLDTINIENNINYHKKFKLQEYQVIRFDMIDTSNNLRVSSKEIIVDKNYIDTKLADNGIFTESQL